MIAVAVALVFYSLVIIVGTWVIARRPAKVMAPTPTPNPQQDAMAKSIAEQHQTLEDIADEARSLSLTGYIERNGISGKPPATGT